MVWHDRATRLVMSPVEFMQWLAATIPRPAALLRPIRGSECQERVDSVEKLPWQIADVRLC